MKNQQIESRNSSPQTSPIIASNRDNSPQFGGYCLETAAPDLAKSIRGKNTDSCPHCGSQSLRIEEMPPDHIHYAAVRCSGCDAFRRWLAKPENQAERNIRRSLIENWLGDLKVPLSEWERQFLQSIREAKSLSPKQSECFQKIQARVGGGE
jgi:hypothetical protein